MGAMTAKNTFGDGLIMDFAPDNTLATCLSNALNATLITMNGNEMSLQNDMGNGRVETAYLPEGYIPVGTCEFGGIIYIASYNPLTNKSLIGCFPSPERNIDSTEVLNNTTLDSSEFLEIENNKLTGKLLNTSIKKVLLEKSNLRAGDKYIIYLDNLDNTYLSDYGNTTHLHNTFPKLVKIHIVSIEDSGKVTYLDSTTKWYDDYYIAEKKTNSDNKIDIDSYRNMLNSGYSIFSSKVSGKLALLIELEKIDSFSCTWEACNNGTEEITDEMHGTILYSTYNVYLNANWEAKNKNINPKYLLLSESSISEDTYAFYKKDKNSISLDKPNTYTDIPTTYPNDNCWIANINRIYMPEATGITYNKFITELNYDIVEKEFNYSNITLQKQNGLPVLGKYYCNALLYYNGKYYTISNGKLEICEPKDISDDIVNYKFNYPVTKKLYQFKVPTKLTLDGVELTPDINNFVYKYTIVPAMPYGILDNLAISDSIDFKKIGTKSIELNTWKYYNYENTSVFTFGLNAYTENNKGIKEIIIEFYDNGGLAAVYHSGNKSSFNGLFTEYFTLNLLNSNYKVSNIDKNGETFIHNGALVGKDENGNNKYENDAGTLYSNCLYLAKIIVNYCTIDSFGNYIDSEETTFNRWYWTSTIFNANYYDTLDYVDLPLELNLDCTATYTANNYNVQTATYKTTDDFSEAINSNNIYKSLSANVQYVNLEGKDNIKMTLNAGLLKDYNTFRLNAAYLGDFKCKIYLGKQYIENTLAIAKCSSENIETSSIILPINDDTFKGTLDSTTSKTLNSLINSNVIGTGDELFNNADAYKNYKNTYNVSFYNTSNELSAISYIGYNGEVISDNFEQYDTTLEDMYNSTLPLLLKAVHYSKYYYISKLSINNNPILKAFVSNYKDLEDYNLSCWNTGSADSYKIGFNKMYFCALTDQSGNNCQMNAVIGKFSNFDTASGKEAYHDSIGKEGNVTLNELLNYRSDLITDNFKFLFPLGFASSWGDHDHAKVYSDSTITVAEHVVVGSSAWNNPSAWALGGTLGATLNTGAIEISDEFIEASSSSGQGVNALTRFTPIVLGYLTQLFYLSDDTLKDTSYYPNNYVYLDDNTTTYTRDIVVNMYVNNNINNYVLFREQMYFGDYINAVIKLAYADNTPDDLNMNNATVVLKECIKNLPILALFNYIKPSMDVVDNNTFVVVKSIYKDLPTIVNKTFNTDTVYGYDKATKDFIPVRSMSKLYKFNSFNVIDSLLTASLSSNTNEFSINKVNKRLVTDGKYLCLNSVPTTYGAYKVSTHNKYRITGFKKGLHFYGD